ncbi:MAG: thermonuclease family protein [Candidatus Hodarchaeales archaeon]|jgi:endonuclease YncB( thermonuclease family)
MTKIKLFWDPKGFELDSRGQKSLFRITDGDTPYVEVSIRMLSIDTPETHYPGRTNPANHDPELKQLAEWIENEQAPIDKGLGNYLHPKLVTGTAGSLQKEQGEKAKEYFQEILDKRLTKSSGKKRKLFLWTSGEIFDTYGRLLAYIAPNYSTEELAQLSYKERSTFNLSLVESGWAASFPIYPSLPKDRDLNMLQNAAKQVYDDKKGAWSDPNTLTGYEFRMCYKLWNVTKKLVDGKKMKTYVKYGWIQRYCVDMTTLEVYEPQQYYKIEPYNRIFLWPKDVHEAVGKLNLVPAN